ncbi:MAG: gliding motility protein GldN [Salinivirgaceae bacterium]|jgi:gliding motility associated protien GldN|nr:gliding motility protein GldN [Salinivirgaceae bacterium]
MRRYILVSVFLVACMFTMNKESEAQVLDGIYVKEHVPARKQVPYKFLREADVMWTKRIWRIIDLNEKINHPLYYPTTRIGDRMSLIDLMLWGINTEGITPYDATEDDRFTQPITRSQIEVAFGAVEETRTYTDESGSEVSTTFKNEINSSEVKQYIVKEDWFFDRQHSIMDVRIIGLCPVRFYTKDDGTGEGEAETRIAPVFWIYFPEARRIFANHEVFNQYNDAERRTFDDIFFKRKFNSYIVQQTNVHDDRKISAYTLGLQSLLEGEKLKKMINDYEQDLWNY